MLTNSRITLPMGGREWETKIELKPEIEEGR
jgi:hypothetical protein